MLWLLLLIVWDEVEGILDVLFLIRHCSGVEYLVQLLMLNFLGKNRLTV